MPAFAAMAGLPTRAGVGLKHAHADGLLGAATPYAKASSALSVAFLQLRKATDHA